MEHIVPPSASISWAVSTYTEPIYAFYTVLELFVVATAKQQMMASSSSVSTVPIGKLACDVNLSSNTNARASPRFRFRLANVSLRPTERGDVERGVTTGVFFVGT